MDITPKRPQAKLSGTHSSSILNHLPDSWTPYAELIRLQKPTGVAMFYFPALFGTLLAAAIKTPAVQPKEVLTANIRLILNAFLVRGLLCTWNDIVDQDLDAQVTRTRTRPLPRGAITTFQACVFAGFQIGASLLGFNVLPGRWLTYGWPFMVLHVLYPYTKRIIYYPQLVLGLAFGGGSVLAFPIFGVDLFLRISDRETAVASLLVLAVTAWTVVFDTIYSAQDLVDDRKAGIKSMMVAHEKGARTVLRIAALVELLALVLIGFVMRSVSIPAGNILIALTCVSTAIALGAMVERVDLTSTSNCGWWFNTGNLFVGMVIGCNFCGTYAMVLLHRG